MEAAAAAPPFTDTAAAWGAIGEVGGAARGKAGTMKDGRGDVRVFFQRPTFSSGSVALACTVPQSDVNVEGACEEGGPTGITDGNRPASRQDG